MLWSDKEQHQMQVSTDAARTHMPSQLPVLGQEVIQEIGSNLN